MNADRATAIFRELTVGLTIPCAIRFYEPAEIDDKINSYQIEIETPLPRGTAKDVKAVRERFGVSEIRKPTRYQVDGRRLGMLYWI